MDILNGLAETATYSTARLQLILAAWILREPFERVKISTSNGDVSEDDYDKRSIYALLYSLYASMGTVESDAGTHYELTFNTWGYTWPDAWGPCPVAPTDPQRFGRIAYTGLYQADPVREYVAAREGNVHVVEMGSGTGAGADHVCRNVLPKCTYEAIDMQRAAIETMRRRFVPGLGGRLRATHADCTSRAVDAESADLVAVCETHVTENDGRITDHDRAFFRAAHRTLKKGGFLVWGNAIPDATWQPCFDFLESIGMRQRVVRDVTREAIAARDEDKARVDAYVAECLRRFHGFRIPRLGQKRRVQAEQALKNFYRNPGTNLYDTMVTRHDSYKVVAFEKLAE